MWRFRNVNSFILRDTHQTDRAPAAGGDVRLPELGVESRLSDIDRTSVKRDRLRNPLSGTESSRLPSSPPQQMMDVSSASGLKMKHKGKTLSRCPDLNKTFILGIWIRFLCEVAAFSLTQIQTWPRDGLGCGEQPGYSRGRPSVNLRFLPKGSEASWYIFFFSSVRVNSLSLGINCHLNSVINNS